jgi:hypothetical protein
MGKQLGKLVRDRLDELNLSARSAAEKTGGLISHVTLQDAANGTQRKMGTKTLTALAAAVQLPVKKVQDAHDADLQEYLNQPLILPAKAAALSDAGRQALVAHMEWLLEQERRMDTPARPRGPRPKK